VLVTDSNGHYSCTQFTVLTSRISAQHSLTESVNQLVKFPAFSRNTWSQLPATCPSPEADEPIPLTIPPVYAEDFVVWSLARRLSD